MLMFIPEKQYVESFLSRGKVVPPFIVFAECEVRDGVPGYLVSVPNFHVEIEEDVNHRELLKKYIEFVVDNEGTDYLGWAEGKPHYIDEEEWKELMGLSLELSEQEEDTYGRRQEVRRSDS